MLAAVAIAATALVTAPQAAADTKAIGLYLGEHQNLGGAKWYFDKTETSVGRAEDKASSVWNDSGYAWVIFEHKNHRGRAYCLYPNKRVHDLHVQWLSFGDKISSVRRLADAGCAGYPPI
ncbi:peptidase inhibitor family I36 protein [Streptomyces sp. NRRL B-1347]|uniref:peptidase inhibitor family I36 protein n=1 Tax=Streptomyces sp. NRRL B-1347 TaxID=1476877 RepID=UPI0004CAC138|nr:peptidase inhibitor family I36 protein [Streptomyces sp. NRRL B-1347]